LYQWGRGPDGHQLRNSGTVSSPSSSINPGHGNFIQTAKDWVLYPYPNPEYRWQGVDGANNPCPPGFRLPTMSEWDTEMQTWSSKNAAGAFASPLKLSMAGYRSSEPWEDLMSVGSLGGYWAYTQNNASYRQKPNGEYLNFTTETAVSNDWYRSWGNSVRCIRNY